MALRMCCSYSVSLTLLLVMRCSLIFFWCCGVQKNPCPPLKMIELSLLWRKKQLLHFGIILLLFVRQQCGQRQQREKHAGQEKCGFIQSFSQRLDEHTASTTTSSESLVWVIENIISDKHKITFLI